MSVDTGQRREAWARSANLRRERARIQNAVRGGVSLAVLLAERREALLDVECGKLVAWLPQVGAAKASFMLTGLPARERFRNLTPANRDLLMRRIREREQHALTYESKKEHAHA